MNMRIILNRNNEEQTLQVKTGLKDLNPAQKKGFGAVLVCLPLLSALLLYAVILAETALSAPDVLQVLLNTVLLFLGWRMYCILSVEISGYVLDHARPYFSWTLIRKWIGNTADLRKLRFSKKDLWVLLFFAGLSCCMADFMNPVDFALPEIPQAENPIQALAALVIGAFLASLYALGMMLVVTAVLIMCLIMIHFFAPLFMFPLIQKLLRALLSQAVSFRNQYDLIAFPAIEFTSFIYAEALILSMTLAVWMQFPEGTDPVLMRFCCALPLNICICLLLMWSEYYVFSVMHTVRMGAETESAQEKDGSATLNLMDALSGLPVSD